MPAYKMSDVYAGRYRLIELIGEGGFSEVWKVMDEMTDNAVVALKIYAPEKGLDEYGIRQFRKEYSLTYNLAHPNLMKVMYFDISEGSPFLIMPYYSHGSLSTYLSGKGHLKERQIAMLMRQIGGALEELHQQDPQILHQDIKPDNILIKNEEFFILTDFGISSNTRHTLNKATRSAHSLTFAYAPPERFDSNPLSNAGSDIFSLGVTLYEMCTGKVPWGGNGGVSLLKGAKVPSLPTAFPTELNNMIQACIAINPVDRPHATTVKEWGNFFLEKGYWNYQAAKEKKSVYVKIAASIAVVLCLGIAGYFILSSSKKSSENIAVTGTVGAEKDTALTKGEAGGVETDEEFKKRERDEKIAEVPEKEFATPQSVEEYLNQISNANVPRKVRKKWKDEFSKKYLTTTSVALEVKEGFYDKKLLSIYLNVLMDFPHKVKVVDVMEDELQKIIELHIQSTRL